MYCTMCGFKVSNNSKFCSNCGAQLPALTATDDASVLVPTSAETTSVMGKVPAAIRVDLEAAESMAPESLGVEFDIVGRHISFNADMVAFNKLRKPFSENASKHKAEYLRFYDSKVRSFDDLFQIAYSELKRRIDLSVKFGVQVLMSYGVDHIDEAALRNLLGDLIDPDVVMQPLTESAQRIQSHAASISQSRSIERSSRSQWYGGGFGIKGAVKGAINATLLNIATDSIREIGDARVDANDRAQIENAKRAAFNDPNTRETLVNGVYNCCLNVFTGVNYVLAQENLVPFFSFDMEKINARVNNYVSIFKSDHSIRAQLLDVLCEGLQYCPYRAFFYALANVFAEERQDTILPVAQYFGLESRYIEELLDIDQPVLESIKSMPEGTRAEIEEKIIQLEKLNRRDPYVGASEILASLQTILNPSIRPILTRDVTETEKIIKSYFRKVSILFDPKHVFIARDIPAKSLTAAQQKYAIGMGSDEFPILLADTTFWGSGKAGCLLTNRALYFSRMLEKPIRIPVENVVRLYHNKDSVIVVAKHMENQIIFTNIGIPAEGANEELVAQAFSQLINDILNL